MNSRIMKGEKMRRVLLLALCFLVFLFVMRAKTEVYNGSGPVKATVATASKLWLSGQKMEVRSVASGGAALLRMTVLFLFGLCLKRERSLPSSILPPPPKNFSLQQLHRFLRPPPVQA